MTIIKTFSIFFLAGLFEIGGGYLVWLWIKEDKPLWVGAAGAAFLALYGIVVTWQTAGFARVYAAYGGIFILMSLLWAHKIDGFQPDKFDYIGAAIALLGVCIIYYMPRN